MRFLVTTKVFETIQNAEDLQRQAKMVNNQIQKIIDTGKLIEGGQFADGRGHFFLIRCKQRKRNAGNAKQRDSGFMLCRKSSHSVIQRFI